MALMSSEQQERERTSFPANSVLFTLRIWKVTVADKTEWRGRLQTVHTGQVTYFRDWDMLIVQLSELLLDLYGRSK